jgi:hypothetical protein
MVPNLKQREMIGKRNSGKFKQDAVLGQFSKDARSTIGNTTVTEAIRQGKAKAEYVAKQEAPVRVSFKFLATGK